MAERREVELHSHDFEWEELARECRLEEDERNEDGDGEAEGLADEAKSKWDAFHARNKALMVDLRSATPGKVYKPRNYLVKEFPELLTMDQDQVNVLELGCGYGSAIFPILAECPKVRAQVCDFSAHAIDILKQNPLFDGARCRAFVCDVAREPLHDVAPESIDVALMVFAMSAVPPSAFLETLRKVREALRPGGLLCFRDYGLYDLAMRRNAKKLGQSLFYRSDGTLAYFFSREDIVETFGCEAGFEVLENEYCTVRLVNRKKHVTMDRVWLHAKLRKPVQ